MRTAFVLLLLVLLAPFARPAQAQNIQLHYDFGRQLYAKDQPTRPRWTTTVEQFRPDRWGNTFYFIDMNYANEGVESAYWEISREFSLGKTPFAAHIEYDGGLSNKFSYNNAYLVGVTYAWNAPSHNAGFTITPMYKYLAKQSKPNSWQLTGTWYRHFAAGAVTFCGFADVWGDRNLNDGKNNVVFITEPQLWLNLNKLHGVNPDFRLSVGTEVEVSHNFAVTDKTIVNPTLALKWSF
ncbi:MAG: DUF5020 family protein [Prevotellaceae bacterium]|nr:DUF5020 family protein [Prevotellaceae bacterium]